MERIGGYLVERKLGEGGMGTVYLARTRGGRAVALKVAKAELAADPVFRERFRSEVEAARAVGGFHTAPVVDAALDGDPLWLATAYIPGPTLAERLAAEGAMDEPRLRALGAALAEALESIHSCGLVHRDLKPGNIIMAADGPRVLDFGISRAVESNRLTATGTAFGTPGFLAPEQALGHDVTGAADVFALGAVLVAAAGGSPWGEGTPMGLMYRSVHEPPDVSAVPAALVDVVSACLAKEPADRPSPSALLDLLTDADADTDPGPSDTPPYPPTLTASPAPATPAPAPSAAAPSTPVPAPAVVAPSTPVPAPAVVAPSTPVPAPAVVAPPPPATPPQPPLGSAAPSYQQPVQTATPPHLPAQPATPPHLPAQPATPPHLPAQPAAPQAPYGFGPPIAYGNPYAGPDPEVVLADAGAGVVVNAAGVLLELAGATADFPWNEIARVERSWRGHRLTVTVRLWDGGVYSCELNARRQSRLRAWLAQLDPVLARYLNR
ncbi:serine/threonine-protein kinase [Streptomyces sp. SP2-10]|uniref:serine/threonine-protein kinase n=1 Tax=Streptomyces sp. SP2-10 TaxID=2873385 RepID=UPI001CA67DB3|nr:serine/threonine-protein kinase [Streptomyces sp. SP2-10]MBY8844804.1 serine/threonine protein kinase [Streptomyces sp. SP2-10]